MPSHRCLIAFGANLGSRAATWEAAQRELAAAGLEIEAASRLHSTAAVGGPAGQPDYLNAALVARTDLEPRAVLDLLREVESGLGRTRAVRWEPRVVDLDLLLFDDRICDVAGLTLPHPRMAWRRFVLEPAAEIASDWRHPVINATLGELARRLRGLPRLVVWLTRSSDAIGQGPNGLKEIDIRIVNVDTPGSSDSGELVATANEGGWIVMAGAGAVALAVAAEQARLLVWERSEWPAGGREAAWVGQHRGAVMDLARESGLACDDLAAAIRAME